MSAVEPSSPTEEDYPILQSTKGPNDTGITRVSSPSAPLKKDSPRASQTSVNSPEQSLQPADANDVFSETYRLKQPRHANSRGAARDGRGSSNRLLDKGKGTSDFDTINEEYDRHHLFTEEYDLGEYQSSPFCTTDSFFIAREGKHPP